MISISTNEKKKLFPI